MPRFEQGLEVFMRVLSGSQEGLGMVVKGFERGLKVGLKVGRRGVEGSTGGFEVVYKVHEGFRRGPSGFVGREDRRGNEERTIKILRAGEEGGV